MVKTKQKSAQLFSQTQSCVDAIIERVGKKIVLGLPLGAGKPNHFVNAIYDRAKQDGEIDLTILTALTLEKPSGNSLLEKRFMEPFADRVFEDYPDLFYEIDRTKNQLPSNIKVIEFYFPAGKFSHNLQAQRNYISCNYTHVVRDMMDRDPNVIAQMVNISLDKKRVSLSCNADVTTDIMEENKDGKMIFVGQVNRNLPYMFGDADIPIESFDYIIDNPEDSFKVFGPPKMSVSDADYMIGLLGSTLVRDDGELQVGIGSLGDALVYALKMRHEGNHLYEGILKDFKIDKKFEKIIDRVGGTGVFEYGLFGATEMLVDSFMFLVDSGIMKRKVYDHIILQRLINEGFIVEDQITPETLYLLLSRRAISAQLTKKDFDFLQHFGIFKEKLKYENGKIIFQDNSSVEADLNKDDCSEKIASRCIGDHLKNGAIIHGGFFLGPTKFYQWLRGMPERKRRQIHMKSVRKINQLYGHEEIDRLHRKNARFINTCLMMTLSGAAVSDGLEDGTVISGVGGQYNFVDMAHALPDGHSILQLRSTRSSGGKTQSNIVWNYGHTTIPRHLRDIVITEYGIAFIRGKTDEEIIKDLIQIADSRFQDELVAKAKSFGKLSSDYEVPAMFKNNFPKTIQEQLTVYKKEGLFPVFPFGTDFTQEEQVIGKALKSLKKKTSTTSGKLMTILKGLTSFGTPEKTLPYLERMQLKNPKTFEEKLYRKLLVSELKEIIS